MTVKKIEGVFPNWQSIINGAKDNKVIIPLNREELIDAIQFATLDTAAIASFTQFSFRKGKLTVFPSNSSTGEFVREMECGWDGEFKIAASASNMLPMLRAFGTDAIELRMSDAMSPICIRQDGATGVVMPCRVA